MCQLLANLRGDFAAEQIEKVARTSNKGQHSRFVTMEDGLLCRRKLVRKKGAFVQERTERSP